MANPEPRPRVLIVDDDPLMRNALVRELAVAGYDASAAASAQAALEEIDLNMPEVVVSDLYMPGKSGVEMLLAMRSRDLDLPVIFLTGVPTVQTAARAVELGAFRYLTKPARGDEIRGAIADAIRARAIVRAHGRLDDRLRLDRSFRSALDTSWIAFQPIVAAATRQTIGYEALLRSRESALGTPLEMIDAAEKLGALHRLGQLVRARVAEAVRTAPPALRFFVNLHVADLADPDLFDPNAPLSQAAHRIVLELTERASLEGVPDLLDRIGRLRELGYRLAIDDLGAGYAGLSYFASVRPEVIKIDLSLVRGVDGDPVKAGVIRSLAGLAAQLGGIEIVAEGVETTAERDALVEIGCTYLQGYVLARPGPAFPEAAWPSE